MTMLSQIAYSGLHATQLALSGTAHNVANVNTPGFSRVGTVMGSTPGYGGLSAGGGVQVVSIRRISSDFYNHQLWRATSEKSYHDNTQQYLSALEGVMAGDGASISVGLDRFFAALSELSTTPESTALRQQVVSEAGNLAARFNLLAGNVDAQVRSLQAQRSAMVDGANRLMSNVAALNQQIVEVESVGGDSKALRDHRDILVQDLSTYASVRVLEAQDGSITVSLDNGQPLVAGSLASTLELATLPSGDQALSLAFSTTQFPLQQSRLGGALGGLHMVEQGSLKSVLNNLHDMASALSQAVNDTLATGYDLNGNPGAALFSYDPSSITGMLSVQPLSAADLALSGVADEVGNNEVLLQLLKLGQTPLTVAGNLVTLNEAYAAMLGRVASDSRQTQADLQSATTVQAQAQARRDSVSAVNLDEEAVNLLNFQQAYQANMKIITTANALFDDLLAAF